MAVTDTNWGAYFGSATFLVVFFFLICAELRITVLRQKPERMRRWSVNLAMGSMQLAAGAMLPVSIVAVAAWTETRDIGLLNILDVPFSVRAILTVLISSLFAYLLHYASHNIFWLWRLHSVHHSDHFVDATTALRTHPLEQVLTIFYFAALAVLFGYSAIALILYFAVETAISLFSHSHIHLPKSVETILSKVIVTPTTHHIHHSAFMPETNSNYGNALTIWDRMFGTFRASAIKGGAPEVYGLEDTPAALSTNLEAQLMRPFKMRPMRRKRV